MKLYILAGEDSGDLHASKLMEALRGLDKSWEFRGIGGDKMITQGLDHIAHIKDVNFMGFFEVVQHLGTIRRMFRKVKEDLLQWKPDAILLVDYPGFNLRMAPFIKEELGIPIIYYISPQLWAWKKGRVKTIRKYVDKMMVILPFEKDFYAEEHVEADFVGHPLLDVIPPLGERNPEPGLVALLPGSRKQEIQRMLPVMLSLPARFPDLNFIVAGAPSQSPEFYHSIIGDARVSLVQNDTYELLKRAETAVVTSGTATLEAGLFGVPEVVVYKAHPISYLIGKRLMQVAHMSLVNLILDRRAVPELLQSQFNPDTLAETLEDLRTAATQKKLGKDFVLLRKKLGDAGAAERAAHIVNKAISQ
ncbi:MAG: lipid-A-disaccharide synthase [Bacteroidia bacterium]